MDIPCKVCGEPWDVLSLSIPTVKCTYSGDWYGHARPIQPLEPHSGCDNGTCRYRWIQIHPDHQDEDTYLHADPGAPRPAGEDCPHHVPVWRLTVDSSGLDLGEWPGATPDDARTAWLAAGGSGPGDPRIHEIDAQDTGETAPTDDCPGCDDYTRPMLCIDGELYDQPTCSDCGSVLEQDCYTPSVLVSHYTEYCLPCGKALGLLTWEFPCPECKGTGMVDGESDMGDRSMVEAFKRGEGCPCCAELDFGADLSPEDHATLDALWNNADPIDEPDGMASDYEDFSSIGLIRKVR